MRELTLAACVTHVATWQSRLGLRDYDIRVTIVPCTEKNSDALAQVHVDPDLQSALIEVNADFYRLIEDIPHQFSGMQGRELEGVIVHELIHIIDAGKYSTLVQYVKSLAGDSGFVGTTGQTYLSNYRERIAERFSVLFLKAYS